MGYLKKCVCFCLILLYGYNQSIFSHLLIIEQHHETNIATIATQNHIHESGKKHQHTNKTLQPCHDFGCKTVCESIETSKLTVCQSNKSFSENEIQYSEINLPIKITIYQSIFNRGFSYYLIPTGPPIPIEELMPRIGPVVRII